MKRARTPRMLVLVLLACLVVSMSACDRAADQPLGPNEPTIPEDVAVGTGHLDVKFAEKYDEQVTGEFAVTFPSGYWTGLRDDTVFLLGRYTLEDTPVQENTHDSDGMQPYQIRERHFTLDRIGDLYVTTDFYGPDGLEYVRCVWTDIPGTKTSTGVGIGSSEKDLLTAYPGDLYYLDKEDMEPIGSSLEDAPDAGAEYAYAWQPFTAETNEIRDITFYMKDGTVVAIELVEPFELRYVYGFDREMALQKADENRESIVLDD